MMPAFASPLQPESCLWTGLLSKQVAIIGHAQQAGPIRTPDRMPWVCLSGKVLGVLSLEKN